MTERVEYPSVETILEVGGKKAPSGLPGEVVNRFAFLDHISGRPPLKEQWWFLDENNTHRQLTPEEMAKLVGYMSRMVPVNNRSFGEIMEDFFRANSRLEHLRSIDNFVFPGEAKKAFGESLVDEKVDVAMEAIEKREEEVMRLLVHGVMSELPEKHRRVLYLHFREGLTHKKIGEIIGLSRSGVGLRMKEALKAAREVIKKRQYQGLTAEIDFS